MRARERLLAHAHARLRAWHRCAHGTDLPLLIEADVAQFGAPWGDATSYVLSVDQPWPQPLEGFRDQFVGTRDGQPVALASRDGKIAVAIRPLGEEGVG